jgi:phosphoserine aminotransferase
MRVLDGPEDLPRRIASLLAEEGVALDVGGHRDAPPSLRVWCGATVEREDLEALTPWLDWAFAELSGAVSPSHAGVGAG